MNIGVLLHCLVAYQARRAWSAIATAACSWAHGATSGSDLQGISRDVRPE